MRRGPSRFPARWGKKSSTTSCSGSAWLCAEPGGGPLTDTGGSMFIGRPRSSVRGGGGDVGGTGVTGASCGAAGAAEIAGLVSARAVSARAEPAPSESRASLACSLRRFERVETSRRGSMCGVVRSAK